MAVRKFITMVGNDVTGELVFDDVFPHNKKLYDALTSSVDIVIVDNEVDVRQGYFWNGQEYVSQLPNGGE